MSTQLLPTELKKLEKQLKFIEEIKLLEGHLIDLHKMCELIVLCKTKSAVRVRISNIAEINDDNDVLFDGDGSLTKPIISYIEKPRPQSTILMNSIYGTTTMTKEEIIEPFKHYNIGDTEMLSVLKILIDVKTKRKEFLINKVNKILK